MPLRDQIARREYNRLYRQSEKGKAAKRKGDAKYRNSPKGKLKLKTWRESEYGRLRHKIGYAKFMKTEKGKLSAIKKTRKGASQRECYNRLRMSAMIHYGGDPPKCACECGCNQQNIRMLTLDHVNNDGALHRIRLGIKRGLSGQKFLRVLKKLGWPKDTPMRVLCYNCNCGRNVNAGICPNIRIIGPEESRRPNKNIQCEDDDKPVGQQLVANNGNPR